MPSLRPIARKLVYRYVGGTAVVLIYHRVADLRRDTQALAVSTAGFDAQMALLADGYRVMPLGALADQLRARHVPDRAVAVTFDDGYADNLLNAAPVLVRHGIPATMYLNSGCVDRPGEFWWDELEQILLLPGTLPRTIDVALPDGSRRTFDLGEWNTYTEEQADADADWTAIEPATNPRQRAYAELSASIKPLSETARTGVLRRLHEVAGTSPRPRDENRGLSAEELRALDALPGISVGAHTRSHQLLAASGVDEQRSEILEDRDALVTLCGHAIDSFSYPYGALGDYTDETVAIVRGAGFTHACANHPAVVKPWTDPFRIPRNVVFDWDATTFAAKLKGWFDDPR
jgi:peptidoglycan/xylan/chitin deacetylase (PgdA/CDA1 family)